MADPIYLRKLRGPSVQQDGTDLPGVGRVAKFNFRGFALSYDAESGLLDVGPADSSTRTPVDVATTTALPAATRSGNTFTANANGTLSAIDGVSPFTNMRVLDKDHATAASRGVMTIDHVGSASTPAVWTRAADFDDSSEFATGAVVSVTAGTVNAGRRYILTVSGSFVLNTDSVVWTYYNADAIEPGTELGQKPEFNGTTWVPRRGWITPDIDPTGTVSASTAIQAALNSRPGVCVYLPEGYPRLATALTWPTANGVTLLGRGTSNETVLQIDSTALPGISVSNVQHPSIRNLMIRGARVYESGGTIRFAGCFQPTLENVRIDQCGDGVHAVSCTETWLWDLMTSSSFGSSGILYYGVAGATANAMKFRGGSHNIAYHYAITSVGDWAASTAYVQGDVRWANGKLWQCSTAGTSAGSGGPSALPSTDPALARSMEVTDNTAKWRFVCQGTYTHLAQGPYSAALSGEMCSFIHGVYGFRVYDDVVAAGSTPIISFLDRVEFDHNYETAIQLERGDGMSINNCWISSILKSYGVDVQANFGRNWKINNTEVFGCAKDGMLISKGSGMITGCNIGNNSQSGSGNYDGIRTAAGIEGFLFNNNVSGILDSAAAIQRYGINVVAGASDHYSIQGNLVTNNVTGGVNDGGTGVNKTVSGNPV